MDTSNPSSSSHQWKYHVFLSFRGEDTRKSFTDHLHTALKQEGIITFRDKENLERGKPISLELLKAIEESLFAIVILSRNYASSTWCLDELVKIMECREKIGLIVWPIFYDVDPFEVRKLMGSYAEAFIEHEKNFKKNINKVHTWKATLTKVANLAGFSLQDRHESEFIQDIVKKILKKLSCTFLKGTKDLVGIDSRVEDLLPLLAIGSNDVRLIGVWGMGGIGKTTLARVVYQKFSEEFEDCSFITNINISEESIKYSIPHPQDVNDKVLMIKNRLYNKRILLVLDDVHQFDQLEKLAREPNWFGPGSRVIITTRDKHLLTRLKVYGIYEAKGLSNDDALQLFSLNAFSNDHPDKDYQELSMQFVNYAKGLPLAIEVLGSFLMNRSLKEWVSTLDRLKQFPEKKINNTLQIGFDGLEDTEKEIFIHIACFFNMKNKDYVVKILECLGLHPDIGIRILIEKSLLKEYENKLWMHELLQIMGQDIVRRDFPQEPRKWSKLWLYEDVHNVLMKNMGAKAIKGLVLDLHLVTELGELHKSKEAHWNPDAFSKMPNLELLIIYGIHLLHGPKELPNGLRFLDWIEYPSKSLPLSFQPDKLVELHMCHSKVEQLWKGKKYLDKLKFIELSNSLSLIETPDFTGVPNLEKLVVKGCIRLIKVHPSVVVHKRLTLLDLEGCKNLSILPKKFEMESLEILNLSNCSKIKRIPEFMGNMECLSKLHLDGTAIMKLPSSVEHLTNLAALNLRDCKNLVCLPSNICNFKLLKELNVAGCSKLDNLPENWNVVSLEELDLSGIALRTPPVSIVCSINLKVLSLMGCKLPQPRRSPNPVNLLLPYCLKVLSLMGCKLPLPRRNPNPVSLLLPYLPNLCSLTRLNLSNCDLQTIPNDIGCLSSLEDLNLSENSFHCLPKSIIQLSKLKTILLKNCTRLRSLPPLPSSTRSVFAEGCTLLEILPQTLIPDESNSLFLYFFDCFELANIQGIMFFRMLCKAAQGIYKEPKEATISTFFPGSEIMEWFSHQSMGNIVKAQVTPWKQNLNIQMPTHSCNKWMGMAACAVFSPLDLYPKNDSFFENCHIICYIEVGVGELAKFSINSVQISSHHLWLLYFRPEFFDENARAVLSQIDENESIQLEVRFQSSRESNLEFEKCGFQLVYEQDMEDIRELAQLSSISCITSYEDVDAQHDLDDSMLVIEGTKIMRSHDECDEAGPSGESSFNNVPHLKRNQTYLKEELVFITLIAWFNISSITSYEDIHTQHDLEYSMMGNYGTKIMQSHRELCELCKCDEAGPSGESSSNDVPHLKRYQAYIKEDLAFLTLIALVVLLIVVLDWLFGYIRAISGVGILWEGLDIAEMRTIEDTDDPETNLLINRIHFGKMFARHRKLTKKSILILSFSTHFNLLHQRHSKSARSSGLSLFALSLFMTQAVASSVFERLSIYYLAISKINVALQSLSQDKQL